MQNEMCQTWENDRSFDLSLLRHFYELLIEMKIRNETTERPDSVIELLQTNGVTKTHIVNLITKYPPLLFVNPVKTLKPKIEFFQSPGFSRSDIVNTRQQTDRIAKKGLISDSNSGRESFSSQSHSNGSDSTLRKILQVIRTEGWGGLYRGLKPSLFGTAASPGNYYYFYQLFKNKAEALAVARKKKGLGDGTAGIFSWILVAAIAGSLNVSMTIPIWVLVTRMQTHTQAEMIIMEAKKEAILRESAASASASSPTNLMDVSTLDSIKPRPYETVQAMREVYSEAGIKGFWKGVVPALVMVCNPSIQFMIYESLLKHLRAKRVARKQNSKGVSASEVFLVGALAKLGATVTTYPLLVVKSRLQAKPEIGGDNISLRYTGTMDAIVKMIRYEGLFSFYEGMSTKLVQSVLATSILFMVKEELVKTFLILADKTPKVIPYGFK
ncbi:peroxisomal nicotinamide adenine dinucleotide carrier-like [Telopea speciosissima]|uniref:peroxisomal nicotinamide adenine dinucleotide carrier-like n=1 Tax=Telopea speciosissima TaxID=54955 RepID=UPI001CC5D268|nr:peroxisomal nicotinamide adenine dinucleotide carrier-like [Telopea speciosissima]